MSDTVPFIPIHPVNYAIRAVLLTLALVLICLPIIFPFFSNEMQYTDDGNLHMYRAIALDHSLQVDDTLYPRYSSGLAYGYGSPLFNYFPPTAYYVIVLIHNFGVSFVAAFNSSMALYVLIAAFGAYLLGSEWTDDTGGLLVAAAYVYAPYFLFDVVTRGTLTEVAALALLPYAVLGFTRLAFYGERQDFILAVLAYALFILMHNIVTVHGTFFLIAYCAFLWLSSERGWQTFTQLFVAALISVLLTAFFWFPALAETDAVKINSVTELLNFVDVTNSLRPLNEILALPQTADTTQLNQTKPIALGWVQIIAASVGLGVFAVGKKTRLFALAVLMAVITIITVLMQLPIAAPIWEIVPLLDYSQFAWRILGIGNLSLALLAGLGLWMIIQNMQVQWRRFSVFGLFLVLLVIYGMPFLYAPQIQLEANTIADAQNYERETGQLALSSYSEYLPAQTVNNDIDPNALTDYFAVRDVVPRLQENRAVRVTEQTWQGTSAELEIEVLEQTRLTFDWLYLAGWSIEAVNDAGDVFASAGFDAKGYLQSGVLAPDSYQVVVHYEGTRTQRISWGITGTAIALLVITVSLAWFIWGEQRHRPTNEDTYNWGYAVLMALIGMSLILIKANVIDRYQNPIRADRFADGVAANVENSLYIDFNGEITLLAANVVDRVENAENTRITLFWRLSGDAVNQDYSVIVTLRDAQGNVIAEMTKQYPGDLATSNWLKGFYIEDTFDLPLPDYTPPDTYQIEAGLFNSDTGERISFLNADGNPDGVDVLLDSVMVEANDKTFDLMPNLGTSDTFALLDMIDVPSQAQVGDEVRFSWVWQALNRPSEDVQAKFVWQDINGTIQAESAPMSLTMSYPTSAWVDSAIWRGWHRWYVPPELDSGAYSVGVEIEGSVIPVGRMDVTVPERNFDAPSPENELDIIWVNGVQLLGYDLVDNALNLYWTTDERIDQNLRLFVHLLDADEQIITVRDGVPVDWTRPTTGWVDGEYIVTVHTFDAIDAENNLFRIGWYNPETAVRVGVVGGEDSVVIVAD